MNYLANMDLDLDALSRDEERAYRTMHYGVVNASFEETKDRALTGQAIAFNVPFEYGGETVMFEPDAFGDLINDKVEFKIDHIASSTVASTDDAFSVIVDDTAVQVWLDLKKCSRGAMIARMCEIDSRASLSVGCDVLNFHRRQIAGQSVKVITHAKLREVSAVREGAHADAFAYVVDTKFTSKPVARSRTATFEAAHKLHKVARSVRSLKATVTEVHAYVDRPPVKRSMTIAELNRLTTAETEERQRNARRMHSV